VREQKTLLYQELLETSLQPMPGAGELLERLYGRTRLAVASSSFRNVVEYVLQRLDFARFMEVVACREDAEHGKPAPDIFLYVAGRLGVEPGECVVVEDAEKGIIAAEDAGMQSIAVPNRYTRDNDFSASTYIAESLAEVEGLVERL
jgi:HAD superfamily hydrolase (TIGR01509 family)